MKINKICGCGQIHSVVPAKHTKLDDDALAGIFFNCLCGSTLFIPAEKKPDLMKRLCKDLTSAHVRLQTARELEASDAIIALLNEITMIKFELKELMDPQKVS